MSRLKRDTQRDVSASHLCVSDLLQWQAHCIPNAPAIIAPGRSPLTYGGLYRHIGKVVKTLRAKGLNPDDRIGLVLPNGPEMASAIFAVAAGATCVPLNPAYSLDEFAFFLDYFGVNALIVQKGLDTSARSVAQTRHLTTIELTPDTEAEAGIFSFDGTYDLPEAHPHFSGPEDVAIVLHTAGTTSRPKIVPLTHRNVCASADNTRQALGLIDSDRCLNVLPLFHTYGPIGTLLPSWSAGACVVCTSGFKIPEFFDCLEALQATWYPAVPTVHQAILEHVKANHTLVERHTLRFIRSGSAPLPPAVLAGLERVFKVPVIETYGMTETSVITCNPPPQGSRKAGSVGKAVGQKIAVMGDDGAFVSSGETGEILVSGAAVISGYEKDALSHKDAFIEDWFRTGDQGYIDEDGYLFITGRYNEIIHRGGVKIAPQEIDDVLMGHPDIFQAVSFAIPHPTLGSDIAAAVVLRQGSGVKAPDIRRFVAARIADFKVPRHIYLVDEIPKGPTGKLRRLALAEAFGHGQLKSPTSEDDTAPRSATEEGLVGIWAQVLGFDNVALDNDFFLHGGDSLMAMQIISRVRDIMHVELSYHSFFATPTVAEMARHIDAQKSLIADDQAFPITRISERASLPLSYAQQRLCFLEQLTAVHTVHNLPLAWRFSGNLDVLALEQSLNEIISRHEILRTVFVLADGKFLQVIKPALDRSLAVVDLQVLPRGEREPAVHNLIAEEADKPFDLACGPLIRVTLLSLAPDDFVLLLTLHHIVFDGWSVEIFWRELTTCYKTICSGMETIPLPTLPIQYADYAIWQQQRFHRGALQEQLSYWKRQLEPAMAVLDIPADRPRPPVQSFRGASRTLNIGNALTIALKALCREAGVTLFMVMVAAFKTLLYRYSGTTDIAVGTPVAGRTRVELETLLGFFVNTLVLRTHLEGNPSFRDLLQQVREVTVGAYDHQELPFEKLVEAIRPERDLSRNPLFQVMIALQQTSTPSGAWPGLTVYQMTVDRNTTMFDLTLVLQDTEQGIVGRLEYATDLFNDTTVARMLEHFQVLLEAVVADSNRRISDLPLLTPAERQQVLVAWNETAAVYPKNVCMHHLFETQIQTSPDVDAVVCQTTRLTYRELNRRANQLAHYLRAFGVGSEVCVGLCVERSVDMIVGLLGILKAGGAYVPMEPSYPSQRLAFMMTDAHVPVIVTQQQWVSKFPDARAHVICLDTDWDEIARHRDDSPISNVTPENLAYVMYTSGSTGRPKGVMVEHRQVVAFLWGFEHIVPQGKRYKGASVCPFSFDVSVWEFFSTLCSGGTLHILMQEVLSDARRFVQYLREHRITSTYIPPAVLPLVADQIEQAGEQLLLDRMLVGVEPIKQAILQRFRDYSRQMCIVNGYGPTEATICATLFPFDAATELEHRTPIGKPIPGYELYVVDAHMQPVPMGIPGELLIGGVGLARGYLNRSALNADAFIPNPFRDVPGSRLYKTGDRVRYLTDGNLEFLGRYDQQIKHRGYRIELEEIEAVLGQHPNVHEAVVALQDVGFEAPRLVAYCTAVQTPAPLPVDLRHFLMQMLPDYMIPARFLLLDVLPRTPNGKVDRHALPIPDAQGDQPIAPYVAPQNAAQQTLVDIWGEVLGLERVGIHDNFFDLGGDSIRSIQIIARANQAGLQLSPKQLFEHQTIACLALVAGSTPVIRPEQGLVSGRVNLTPIQKWFFDQAFPESHHWNQTVLVEVPPTIDVSILEHIIPHLLAQHDMLRARFTREASAWKQYIVDVERSPVVSVQDLSTLSDSGQAETMASIMRQYQTRLDLLSGPLMRVVLFRLGAHRPNRLLIIVHHLVIDYVSWLILLEDLQTAYRQLSDGQSIHLPAKTTSYQAWGEQLVAYAQSDGLRAELPFWLAAVRHPVLSLPMDDPAGANTVASACMVSVSLSREETRVLLNEVHQAYRTQIDDLLITALGQAFASWTGSTAVLFDMEGHGREDILEGVDLSRTVGWFTTLYPIRLQVDPTMAPAGVLKMVKEQLRRIPNRGIGYGVLRYLCQDEAVVEPLRALPQAEVCFNYLGQLEQGLADAALFKRLRQVSAAQRSGQGQRRYLLEVNGCIVDGELQLDWTYSAEIHRRDTVERLAGDFIEALQTLIVHCLSPAAGGYTPSDFPSMSLSQQELDALLDALDQTEEGI